MIGKVLFACLVAVALSRRTSHDEVMYYHDGVAGPVGAPGANPWGPAPGGAANPWAAGSTPAPPGAFNSPGGNPWGPAPGGAANPWGANPNVRPGTPGPTPWGPAPGGAVNPWGANSNIRPGTPTGNPWGPAPGGATNPWGPNSNIRPGFGPNTGSNANVDDFMMRLSGTGLNCPGIRVSVNRGLGRQEYKYEGPIQLSCVAGARTIQQGSCYNYRECSQLICRFVNCKNQGGVVRKRKL